MMVGVLISYSISGAISMSMYNVILKIKGLPYLPSIKTSSLYQKTVHDMSSSKICIMQNTNIRKILYIVHEAQGISNVPVVDNEGFLVGEVQMEQLKRFIVENYLGSAGQMNSEDKAFLNRHVNPVLTPSKGYLEYWREEDETSGVCNFLNTDVQIEDEVINWAPLSIPEGLPLIKVQFMFIMMGLMQVAVVQKGKFLGVISRESFTNIS